MRRWAVVTAVVLNVIVLSPRPSWAGASRSALVVPAAAKPAAARPVAPEPAFKPRPGAGAKASLGPVGWLWNNIYYRVFQGNKVMMAIFGWELFLSPVVLVFAAWAVLGGVGDAIRKPRFPETSLSQR